MSTRYHCPYCKHKDRKFVRYIDTETGLHLADHVGRCERIESCGRHYKPKQFFHDNKISFDRIQSKPFLKHQDFKPKQKPISFISDKTCKASLKNYEANNFIKFLISRFGVDIASKLISRYLIGTSKHWYGATVFWQIDTKGKVRSGKIMLYNADNGKRVKGQLDLITWAHKVLKIPEFELTQCFFGEHLLKDLSKPVAIVESEKTAIIASAYLPQFIWIATGGFSNLNHNICQVLKGRAVTLFPDLNGYEAWSKKAKELSDIGFFQVSDLLERKATEAERKQGLDLADYLLKFELKDFVDDIESRDH